MRFAPLFAGIAALALAVTVPAPAHACWDGYSATIGRVSINVADESSWSAPAARQAARWGARVDALLPAGTRIEAGFGFVTWCGANKDATCGAALGEVKLSDASFPALFDAVATLVRATKVQRDAALARDASPLTVQVFAARDRRRAEAVARRIDEEGAGSSGFYTAGSFPAVNPTAHVVEEKDARGRKLFRVYVGAFLSPIEAERARTELANALGIRGFTRVL